MNLFEKFRRAEETISQTGHAFTLFGLFEREDISGKFDVVASAPWLSDDRASLNLLAELVRQAIGNDNWWTSIGRFVVLPESAPLVKAVLGRLPDGPVRHDLKSVNDLVYDGEVTKNAIIITAVRPAVEALRPEAVAA